MRGCGRGELRGRAGARPSQIGPGRRRGFTLLEVVIAIGILSFGILGVGAGLIYAMKHSGVSRNLTSASYLAQQQIESFHSMTPQNVLNMTGAATYPNDPTNPIDPDPGDADQTTFNRRWTIAQDTPEIGVMTITVMVDWPDPRGNIRTTTLQTIKAQN